MDLFDSGEGFLARNRRLLVLALIGFVVFFAGQHLLSSYSSMYQGAKAQFFAARYFGNIYTDGYRWGEVSASRFGTTMELDVDAATKDMCNIVGEMTPVFIPLADPTSLPPGWVERDWWIDAYQTGPAETWVWEYDTEGPEKKAYKMEKWYTKWYVTVAADWDSGPSWLSGSDEAQNRRYSNTELWVEFNIEPVWYFQIEGHPLSEGPYFAIAKVQLARIKEGMAEDDAELGKYDPTKFEDMEVSPSSPGTVLTIYPEPFSSIYAPDPGDFEDYTYDGARLNPQYFRDKVYAHLDLNNFGSSEKSEGGGLVAKGDAVTWDFTITQFVVGEWTVRDEDNIDWLRYGKDSKVTKKGPVWLGEIMEFIANGFKNPFTWIGLAVFGLLIVGLAMFWFFGLPIGITRRRAE